MSLCSSPLQSLRTPQSFLPGRPAGILNCRLLLAAAIVFVASELRAADSDFPNFPPVSPAVASHTSASLPQPPVMSASVMTNTVAADATANTSTNPMDALDDQYRLAVGDSIDYQVLEDKEDPDDSGEAQSIVVTDSGDVQVPYVGRYSAEGKTCKELANQLKLELEKKYYYKATVIISVKSMTSKGVIYVMGGVKVPGPLELPRDEELTISKAVMRAGGFDDFADGKHVQVTRKTESGTNDVFTVNVSAVLDKHKIEDDQNAEPGDFIYVPEKTFRY
jgi:protein involved in polysaccharide export with SLBB domain